MIRTWHLNTRQTPIGLRKSDGGWQLFHGISLDQLGSYLCKETPQSEPPPFPRSKSLKKQQNTEALFNYILQYHPEFTLCDISPYLKLQLHTHLRGANTNPAHWCGGIAGSVQWEREEAMTRTLGEVLERTALTQVNLPLEQVWGSAVAPTDGDAETQAIYEAMERQITTSAFLQEEGFGFHPLSVADGEAVAFEWKQHAATVEYYSLSNPFQIPVVLARVQPESSPFYGNGIGVDLQRASKKAGLEILQFIPRKSSKYNEIAESAWFRVWRAHPIHINEAPSNVRIFTKEELEITCRLAIQEMGGQIYSLPIAGLPCMMLSAILFPKQYHWSQVLGVPIA